jgi:hypothetical protein
MVGDDEVPAADELAEQLEPAGEGRIWSFGEKGICVLEARHSSSLRFGGEGIAARNRRR